MVIKEHTFKIRFKEDPVRTSRLLRKLYMSLSLLSSGPATLEILVVDSSEEGSDAFRSNYSAWLDTWDDITIGSERERGPAFEWLRGSKLEVIDGKPVRMNIRVVSAQAFVESNPILTQKVMRCVDAVVYTFDIPNKLDARSSYITSLNESHTRRSHDSLQEMDQVSLCDLAIFRLSRCHRILISHQEKVVQRVLHKGVNLSQSS